jgi:hypothetical protein
MVRKMTIESLTKFWPLIYSNIQEFWSITEPHIEDAAIRNDIPIELYLYSELGLERFSIQDFQKRDPFSNPEQFERLFVRLNLRGWIEPKADGSFRVTERARETARILIQEGDVQLSDFSSMPVPELKRLLALLKQIVMECYVTPEPPGKWAILKRFRVADEQYPFIMQIREYLMDLYAYRDDSHLSAARPYFNDAGIVWLVLGSLETGDAVNAEQMAEKMAFRGYELEEYEIALQAALELGWVQPGSRPGKFCLTEEGKRLRERAERATNEYFYAPWSVLTQDEIQELHELLIRLHGGLKAYGKSV